MFQQYQNGVTPVTGVSEAGANIGNMYSNALGGFGSSIAEGIKAYSDNKKKDEIVNGELEGIGHMLLQNRDILSRSPETKNLADGLAPLIEKFQGASALSRGNREGLLTSGKAALNSLPNLYNMNQAANDAETKRKISEYDATLGTYTKNPVALRAMKQIQSDYNLNVSPEQNTANESAAFDQWAKDHPDVTPASKQEYLSAWNKKWSKNIEDNKELQSKFPDVHARVMEGFAAQEGYNANTMTDDSGVTDYAKEADLYNKTTVSANDLIKNKLMEKDGQPASIIDSVPAPASVYTNPSGVPLLTAQQKFDKTVESIKKQVNESKIKKKRLEEKLD